MRPKSLILLVLALGCGLVASIGINQVLANRDKQPVIQMGETEPIYVALTDVGMGEKLNPQNVKLEPWPKDRVPNGALTELEEIEGRLTKTRLFAGEPIMEAKLLSKDADGQGSAALIPKGLRVVSVRVDSVSGGAGLILPGNRVDVMVHVVRNPSRGIEETGTKTVLQDIQVFAVNDLFTRDPRDRDETSISAKTISLLVNPSQAQLVMLASEIGTIRLVLRNHEDEDMANVEGTEIDELLGTESEKGHREEEPEVAAEEPDTSNLISMVETQVEEGPKPWIMLLLKGQAAEEVEFQESQRLPEPMTPGGSIRIPRVDSQPTTTSDESTQPLPTGPTLEGGSGAADGHEGSSLDELFDNPPDPSTGSDYWGEDY